MTDHTDYFAEVIEAHEAIDRLFAVAEDEPALER